MATRIYFGEKHLDEGIFKCLLCHKWEKDPQTLPCHHKFDLSCLTKWVNKMNGSPVCPTCWKPFDGSLEKLPLNPINSYQLESIDKHEINKTKCYCGKNTADYYCDECMQYICISCRRTHEDSELLRDHKLHSMEDIQSMTERKLSLLFPLLCPAHKKKLELYCNVCKVPICMHCSFTDHVKKRGTVHEPIPVSEAFMLLKQTSTKLEKKVNAQKQKIQAAISEVSKINHKMSMCHGTCISTINNCVTGLTAMIQRKGNNLKKHLNDAYTQKKYIINNQIDELKIYMQKVDKQWDVIAKSLDTDDAVTALQSNSHNVIASLEKTIQQLPETEPKDNGEMNVTLNEAFSNAKTSLSHEYLGHITYSQTYPRTLEKHGLVKTITTNGIEPQDVVMDEFGILLVSAFSNEIHRYEQSGECRNKITLPSNVIIDSLYKMETKNLIVFSDDKNKCITMCKLDGHVVKSIGKGILRNPCGITVHEQLNEVYVADFEQRVSFMFNMGTGQKIKKIGSGGRYKGRVSRPSDVTITNGGHFIVVDCNNHTIKSYNNEGKFMRVLIDDGCHDGQVEYPYAVTIDNDNNMLVTSNHKLQLFNSDGIFIKRIDKKEDGLFRPHGLSVSYNPRRVAVANYGGKNIKVFKY